jgi:hypothetical protein
MLKHERQMGTPSISMGTNLWDTWLDIACERERAATDARRRAESTEADNPEHGTAINDELRAAMVAVSASAHALDAFYGRVCQIGTPPPGAERWDENRTPRRSRILETLKYNFDIGKHAGDWAKEFRWLFDLRDAVVHHTYDVQPAVLHPTGRSHVSQVNLDYSLEAAQRAVELATEVMTTCLESPRSEQPKITEWAESMPHVPDHLRSLRRR